MTEAIKKFFKSNKIEYYAVGRYSDFTEARPDIANRESFKPRSVIIYLVPYYTLDGKNISSYAVSRDYHIEIDRINSSLIKVIRTFEPDASASGFGDKSPIDEREAAAMMSLGSIGSNRLLINAKYGSYVFIGEVVTDIPPERLGAKTAVKPAECQHCGACLRACPTGSLIGEGVCLSELTQKKGELTEEEEMLIKKHGTVWGCDICQHACPMNSNKELTPLDFFYEDRITELSAGAILSMPDSEFSRRAYSWRKKKTLLRNLALFDKG